MLNLHFVITACDIYLIGFTVCTLWAGLVWLPVVVLAITEVLNHRKSC